MKPASLIVEPKALDQDPSQLPLEYTRENLEAAGLHFAEFFDEIGAHMIERDDLIIQLQLALLAKKHLLMIGHPGTAKSTTAHLALDRTLCEGGAPSVFDTEFHPESRRSELLGSRIPRVDAETGETELITRFQDGIAPKTFAILDEIFDGPPAVLRGALLRILVDQMISTGKEQHSAQLMSAIAASNKTFGQLRDRFGDELDALIDRFAFVFWTVKRTLRDGSGATILTKDVGRKVAKKRGVKMGMEVVPLELRELKLLQTAADKVQESMLKDNWSLDLAADFYREFRKELDLVKDELGVEGASKMESLRTQNVMGDLLPAIAVMRHIRNPETPLAVIPEDFEELKYFFMMRGPSERDLHGLDIEARVDDKEDQRFLKRELAEQTAFDAVYTRVVEPKARELARGVRTNLGTLRSDVEDWTLKMDSSVSVPVDKDDLLGGITQMKDAVGELAQSGAQVPGGEELLAKAVAVTVRLMTEAIKLGEVAVARSEFRALQGSIEVVERSFHRSLMGSVIEEFQTALTDAYHKTAADSALPLHVALSSLGELLEDESILGGEVINHLTDVIKTAALKRVLGTTVSLDDIKAACAEYRQICELRAVVGRQGISGKVPLDRLIEVHTRTLETLRDMVKSVKAAVEAGLEGPDRDEILAEIDQALAYYHETMRSDEIANPYGNELSDQLVGDFLASRKGGKEAEHPGATVAAQLRPLNGGERNVSIQWAVTREEEREFELDKLVKSYGEFCLEQVMATNEDLLKVPEIKGLHDRLLLLYEVAFGAGWNQSFEELISEYLLDAVRLAFTEKADVSFEAPLQSAKVFVRPMPIKTNMIEVAIEAAVSRAQEDDDQLKKFLEAQGLQPSDSNVVNMRTLLGKQAGQGSTEKINIEVVEVSEETVPITEVVEFAVAGQTATWLAIHDEIGTATIALGGELAGLFVQERLATLTGTSSGPMSPATFVAKYTTFFSAGAVSAGTGTLRHIPVDMTQNAEVLRALEEDLTQVIDGINVTDGRGALAAVIGQPMMDVRGVLINASQVSTGALVAKLNQAAQEKINGWVVARNEKITELTENVLTSPYSTEVDRLEALSVASERFKTLIQAELQRQGDFNAVCDDFGVATAHRDDQFNSIMRTSGTCLRGLAEDAANTVEALQIDDFKMNDLSTLNETNYENVDEKLREGQYFNRSQAVMIAVKTAIRLIETSVDPALLQEIEEFVTRMETLKTQYLAALVSARGAQY